MTACGPRWRSGGRAVQPVATSGRTGAGRQTPAARCPQCAPRSASTKPDCASSRPTKVRIGSHRLRNAPGLAAARPRSEGGRREPPVPPRADHQPRQERHRTPGASSRSPPPTRPATPPARRDHSAMPVAARAWRSAALPAGVRARIPDRRDELGADDRPLAVARHAPARRPGAASPAWPGNPGATSRPPSARSPTGGG